MLFLAFVGGSVADEPYANERVRPRGVIASPNRLRVLVPREFTPHGGTGWELTRYLPFRRVSVVSPEAFLRVAPDTSGIRQLLRRGCRRCSRSRPVHPVCGGGCSRRSHLRSRRVGVGLSLCGGYRRACGYLLRPPRLSPPLPDL